VTPPLSGSLECKISGKSLLMSGSRATPVNRNDK